jgi:hypothetical protein
MIKMFVFYNPLVEGLEMLDLGGLVEFGQDELTEEGFFKTGKAVLC